MSVFHNNALIGAGGGAAAAEAAVATKSLRFNPSDSSYINRTPSSGGNRKTWTWSFWAKRSKLGSQQALFSVGSSDSNDFFITFQADDTFRIIQLEGGSATLKWQTSQVFRDTSAWYHFVVVLDTTQSTSTDRVEIYVNGSKVTDYGTQTTPSQNSATSLVNSTNEHSIGRRISDSTVHFGGYLADIYFIDGSALDATSFGAYDDSGVWQAAAYSGTYGTNGFHLDFADAADLGDDNSGNGNDFTPNNLTGHATVQTYPGVAIDGPTNGASVATGYLSIPASNSSDFNFGTGDFTWEAFILGYDWTGGSSNDDQQVIDHGPTAGGDNSGFFVDGGQSYYYSNKASSRFVITGPTLENGRWYHVAASRESGTLRLFVDGVSQGSASYTDDYADAIFTLGRNEDNNKNQFRGVISNFRVLKGTALYTSNFTVPTTPLTNITNTKLLCCQSSSSATTAAVSPGTIVANGDTNGTERSDSRASNDSLFDVPTNGDQSDTGAGGEVSGNYCCLNPLDNGGLTLSNGNLDFTNANTSWDICRSTYFVSSGKWYWEVTVATWDGTGAPFLFGIANSDQSVDAELGQTANSWAYLPTGQKRNGGSTTSYGSAMSTGAVVGVALDMDAGTLSFYLNGSSQGQAFSSISGEVSPAVSVISTSQHSGNFSINFGQRAFAHSAPSNHKALCTTNLPTPTIADGSDYFQSVLWNGNSSARSITTTGMSPDWVWIKARNHNYWHYLYDAVRGATKELYANSTNAEDTDAGGLTAFNSDGFSLGSNIAINGSSKTFVGWAWDAGSSTVSNTDGSETTSVRANQSAGFSIVTFNSGSSDGDFTCGHGLNAAPELIIMKSRSRSGGPWWVFHRSVTDATTKYLQLSTTSALITNSGGNVWGSSLPTSSVFGFSVGAGKAHTQSETVVSYCFAPVANYSQFGTYEANGSADGPFVYTGFRPAFVLLKLATNGTARWFIFDSTRDTYNAATASLYPDRADAEGSSHPIDFLSNGFKLREADSSGYTNYSGSTYVYAAFAENPFQANGGLAR